jgi:3-dehydroquinate dehydratase-2
MATVLLVNGPNLNTLGTREPELYGRTTLPDIEATVQRIISDAGHELRKFQSNHEGAIVDWLQEHRDAAFLLLNPAAFTHTSVAVRDAIALTGMPFVEIHISNLYKREPFRQHSYFSDMAVGVIAGLGAQGYALAAQFAVAQLATRG